MLFFYNVDRRIKMYYSKVPNLEKNLYYYLFLCQNCILVFMLLVYAHE